VRTHIKENDRVKILVLGASGGVGTQLVRIAAERGHDVTAVARSRLEVPAGVRLVVDDVQREGCLDEVIAGRDVVLSALGIRRKNQPNPWSPLASPADFTSATAQRIVAAMKRHGVRRVIAVSAAGVGDSRPGLNWMMRFFVGYTNVGANYRDLDRMEAVYAASGLDICCVRPTGLKDGPETGRIAQIGSFPFNAWISRADVARWMVEHVDADLAELRAPIITEARS
jgi:putative NADH-flavin reductase